MSINVGGVLPYVAASGVGAGIGIGAGLGTVKAIKKITGKPAGVIGSAAHIYTNDKLDSKAATMRDIAKANAQDARKLLGITAGAAVTSSLVTGNSKKVAAALANLQQTIGKGLGKVNVDGKNLKEMVKSTNIYQRFNSLPPAAKAAILAGTVTLGVLAPYFSINTATKVGYIEGQHETK